MTDGFDANAFSQGLTTFIDEARTALPLGMVREYITFQPDEINVAILGVLNNLWQTIVIVLLVVVAFLGLRTGLLVGAMVPLVMVCSILVMRVAGIDLERMSLASLIISLGLLVDNGIVIAEEIQARLARRGAGEGGESRRCADERAVTGLIAHHDFCVHAVDADARECGRIHALDLPRRGDFASGLLGRGAFRADAALHVVLEARKSGG
jgi:multidrug efflux pump subunit AcrB